MEWEGSTDKRRNLSTGGIKSDLEEPQRNKKTETCVKLTLFNHKVRADKDMVVLGLVELKVTSKAFLSIPTPVNQVG